MSKQCKDCKWWVGVYRPYGNGVLVKECGNPKAECFETDKLHNESCKLWRPK